MNTKTKMLVKRIVAFLIASPTIIKYAKEIWIMLEEIYNQETWNELEEIKKESNREE